MKMPVLKIKITSPTLTQLYYFGQHETNRTTSRTNKPDIYKRQFKVTAFATKVKKNCYGG